MTPAAQDSDPGAAEACSLQDIATGATAGSTNLPCGKLESAAEPDSRLVDDDRIATNGSGVAPDAAAEAGTKKRDFTALEDCTGTSHRAETNSAKNGDATAPAAQRTTLDTGPAPLGAGGIAGVAQSAARPGFVGAPAVPGGIPVGVGHPDFGGHFAAEVAVLTRAGIDRAEINVFPRDLGPVRIELSLSGEAARIAFSAAQPETRQAIEQSLPILKEMLAERGIALSDTSVSDGGSDHSREGERGFSAAGTSNDRRHGGAHADAPARRRHLLAGSRGLLDVYA